MSKYPKVKFKIDVQADISNCRHFIKYDRPQKNRSFLYQFLPKVLHYIVDQKLSEAKKNNAIKEYVERTYRAKMHEIKKGVAKANDDWKKIEKSYFALVDIIFEAHSWPKGKYLAYSSIFGMFPRNIRYKYFYFPPLHPIPKFSNKVVAHEMLHFIFFDYLERHFGLKEYIPIKGKPKDYLWQVSEVFNNVIEGWPPYGKLVGDKPRPYRGTEKMFEKMSRQWRKKQDIDYLLKQWLK